MLVNIQRRYEDGDGKPSSPSNILKVQSTIKLLAQWYYLSSFNLDKFLLNG